MQKYANIQIELNVASLLDKKSNIHNVTLRFNKYHLVIMMLYQ